MAENPSYDPHANAQTAWVEVAGKTRYFGHGRRLTVGSAPRCDVVLTEAGIGAKHVRLTQRFDSRIVVRPLAGQTVRIGGQRRKTCAVIQPGQDFALGLVTFKTGSVDTNLYLHALLAFQDAQRSGRELARRSPWLAISLLLHVLLVILIVEMMKQRVPERGVGAPTITVGEEGLDANGLEEELVESDEKTLIEEPLPPEVDMSDPALDKPFEDEDAGDPMAGIGNDGDVTDLAGESLFADIGTKRSPKPSKAIPKGVSRKFAKTVARLRKTGFEIAFLFDSTSSMGHLLSEAKNDLLDIFLLVEELVPDARMAILTYRDRGDAYVTRETRLGVQHFEALAFLSSVRAEGGGDFPEAVAAALVKAKKLDWRSTSRKITVLIADAPPHAKEMRRAIDAARSLRRRNGQVHCLVVGQTRETWQRLERVARAGGGRTLAREDRDQLAQQLLSLAFGPDSGRDIRRLLDDRRQANDRRRSGSDAGVTTIPASSILARVLARRHPDPVIVEAWTHAPPRLLRALPDVLRGTRLSPEGLQALYYIANRALERNSSPLSVAPRTKAATSRGIPQELGKRLAGFYGYGERTGRRRRRGR